MGLGTSPACHLVLTPGVPHPCARSLAPCPQARVPRVPLVPLSPCHSSCPPPQGQPNPDRLGALTGLVPCHACPHQPCPHSQGHHTRVCTGTRVCTAPCLSFPPSAHSRVHVAARGTWQGPRVPEDTPILGAVGWRGPRCAPPPLPWAPARPLMRSALVWGFS